MILDARRSNLTPATLEIQALVDVLTRAQFRAQKRLRTNDIYTSATLETPYTRIESSTSTMGSTTAINVTSDEEENDYVIYF